jgi:hypothetical protein
LVIRFGADEALKKHGGFDNFRKYIEGRNSWWISIKRRSSS